MSSSERPLTWWSTTAPKAEDDSNIIRTVITILVASLLVATLFQDKIMDLLDAYMELPYLSHNFFQADEYRSFADIPLMLKDRVRGYARRGLRTHTPMLVLRPFARGNGLTLRDSAGIANSTSSSFFWSNSQDGEDGKDIAPQAGMSLSDRFRGRRWGNTSDDTSSVRTLHVPGLVNTGNFCFMNSVLQVLFPYSRVLTIGTCLTSRISRILGNNQ